MPEEEIVKKIEKLEKDVEGLDERVSILEKTKSKKEVKKRRSGAQNFI